MRPKGGWQFARRMTVNRNQRTLISIYGHSVGKLSPSFSSHFRHYQFPVGYQNVRQIRHNINSDRIA